MKQRIITISLMAVLAISVQAQFKVYRNGNVTVGLTGQSKVSKLAIGGTVTAHGLIVPFLDADNSTSLSEGEAGSILSSVMAMDVVSYSSPIDEEEETPAAVHFALSPETLKLLYPSLVSKDGEGTDGINYTEVIPLLVRSIQELQHEVETLKSTLALMSDQAGNSANQLGASTRYSATLQQNSPNPVREQTTIGYSLAGSFTTAVISISDIYGNIVKTCPVHTGTGSVSVNASELGIGMFLYSLIVDNTVVDSKKMVVTK